MRVRRPVALLASTVLAVTGLGVVAGPTSAAGIEYPGPTTECTPPKTLQNCVDSAPTGGTVVLTAQIIPGDSSVTINKSLTLRATDRTLHPQLTSIGVYDHGDITTANHITLQDLVVDYGIFGNFDQASGHSLTIRRVKVGTGVGNVSGILINAQAQMSVTVENSYFRTTGHQAASFEFDDSHATGTSRLRVVGNTVTQHGGNDSGAGIEVVMEGSGTTKADIDNNKIWDVVGDPAGGVSGIFLYTTGTVHADINVVGNTIDRVGSNGLSLRNDVAGGGHVTLRAFDNVFAHTTGGWGLTVDSAHPSALSFSAGHNDYWANEFGSTLLDPGDSAGTGNLHKDPKYVKRSTGDLRLTASSPLIDRGLTCSSGGLVNLDASGNGRLAGKSVDMGAYERGAGGPTGVVRLGTSAADTLTGTSGRDILCGYGGKDVLKGLAGADYLDGGSSNDKLTGGSGGDRLLGGSGKDTLCARDGVHGNDVLNGGSNIDSGQRDSGDPETSVEHATSC